MGLKKTRIDSPTTMSESVMICPFVYTPYLHWKNGDRRNEKSAQRRRKHCALALVRRSQNSPRRFPGAWDGQNYFNQLEMVTTFTYKPSLVSIDTRNFETHPQTDSTAYNTLRRS